MSAAMGRRAAKLAGIQGRCLYVKLDVVLELEEPISGVSEVWANTSLGRALALGLKRYAPKLGVVGYVALEREIGVLLPEPEAAPRPRKRAAKKMRGGT